MVVVSYLVEPEECLLRVVCLTHFLPIAPLLLQDTNSFARGHELFRGGLLTEAVLALEAEVQRTPGNVPAWLLLGTIQAENDDDLQVGGDDNHHIGF